MKNQRSRSRKRAVFILKIGFFARKMREKADFYRKARVTGKKMKKSIDNIEKQ